MGSHGTSSSAPVWSPEADGDIVAETEQRFEEVKPSCLGSCRRSTVSPTTATIPTSNGLAVLVVQQVIKLSPSPKGLLEVHDIEPRHKAIWSGRRRRRLFIIMMSDYEP